MRNIQQTAVGADKAALLAGEASNSCAGRTVTEALLEVADNVDVYLDGRKVPMMPSCFHSRQGIHCCVHCRKGVHCTHETI